MSEWQPIETAPKDGVMFLFDAPALECGCSIGYIFKGKIRSAWDGRPLGDWNPEPKYWMPLPPPPEQTDDAT